MVNLTICSLANIIGVADHENFIPPSAIASARRKQAEPILSHFNKTNHNTTETDAWSGTTPKWPIQQ